MLTNDLKKGAKVILKNGWNATIMDNMRGNIRMAEVDGYHKETGSIYAHDIKSVIIEDKEVPITLTPNQLKCAKLSF